MAAKMLTAPRITQKGLPGFLLWSRRESPALYNSLVREFPEVADFDNAVNAQGMSGLFDFLSSTGSALSSAASKIGSFVSKNALPILAAAAPVLIAKKQADVAITQMKIADAQQAPLQTALMSQNGYMVPVPVRQSIGATMGAIPSWVWIAGAGVGVLGLLFLTRRR